MPLSDERLAEIRRHDERWDDPSNFYNAVAAIDERRELLKAYDEQRAEVEQLRAKVADAWDNGHREGVQDGESGYVAGTGRRLRWTPNPHLATCEHTEHAIGSRGRVGRTFQGTSDPAGRWERCDA